jgi:hypothetical protein
MITFKEAAAIHALTAGAIGTLANMRVLHCARSSGGRVWRLRRSRRITSNGLHPLACRDLVAELDGPVHVAQRLERGAGTMNGHVAVVA